MAMTEPLIATQASVGQIGKDPLGLGFKETVHQQVEAVQAMPVWQAYSKMAPLRECVQQLDSIIADVQQCITKSADGGSPEFVSRLFTLKRQLSASPGYSSWVLRSLADIVDEKLGVVKEEELREMITDVENYANTNHQGDSGLKLTVKWWARAITNKYAHSIQQHKEKAKQDADAFFPAIARKMHDLRRRDNAYKGTGPVRPDPIKWFLWGLVRNINKGNVSWLDELEPLSACKKESGRLVWVSLGFPLTLWSREAALDLGPVRQCEDTHGPSHWEWALGEVVSLDLPRLVMELVNLRSAMTEKLTQVVALQAKALAICVSAGVAGFQLVGNMLMASNDVKYVVGNYTQPM